MSINPILSYFRVFSEQYGELRLTQAMPRAARDLGAIEIWLCDEQGGRLHGRYLLQNAMHEAKSMEIRFPLAPVHPESTESKEPVTDVQEIEDNEPVTAGAIHELPDDRDARFIREFSRLQDANRFMWAGFVVKTLLPQLGFSDAEAKDLFQRLESEGVLMTSKEPNPKNPDFPTTVVRLNREHPAVRQALDKNGAPRPAKFPLGKVSGEPLSETILRERR